MQEEADRRARARMPMRYALIDREHRLLSLQRLADNVGEEAGGRLVWLPRPDADGRQADADPVEETAARVVVQKQLAEKKITLELTTDAKKYLATKGYDPAMGARPMKRLIQDEVKEPIADEILKEDSALEGGGSIKIGFRDAAKGERSGRLTFEFNKKAAPEEKPVPVAPGASGPKSPAR